MKKHLILLFFLLTSTLFANPWDCYCDDLGLRKRFDSINKQYFNSELKVDYINFNNEVTDDSFAITYHWAPYTAFPDREVIAVNPKLMEKEESVIMSVIAHECCHVYVDQNDPDVRYIISRKSGQKIPKIANLQYYKSKANYGTKKKGISR